MTENEKTSMIQAEVMAKIHQGSIKMKPRIYFTILWLLGIVSSLAAGLLIAYFLGMLTYAIRIQTSSTPAYGARQNLSDAFASFPWWALILAAALIVVAAWLMRRYSRIYRVKVQNIIVGFLIVSLAIGIGISYTNIGHSDKNNRLNSSERHSPGVNGRGSELHKN